MGRTKRQVMIAMTARHLSNITPKNVEEAALLGWAVGATFCLHEAVRLGFRDRTGAKLPRGYGKELSKIAWTIANGEQPAKRVNGLLASSLIQRCNELQR